jgi:hypothetical protein
LPELDPVTQRFIADDTQYLAALAQMIAAAETLAEEVASAMDEIQARIDALRGKDIDVKVNVTGLGDTGAAAGGAGGAAAAAAAAAEEAAAADDKWAVSVREVAASQADLEASLARSTETINSYVGYDHLAAAAEQKLAIESDQFAGRLGFLVTSTGDAAAATRDLGAAATVAWRPWFLFGQTWQTALHWIVAGGAELLAVTVPALIALGAGAFVALQGAQNLANHMQAVWTAFEAAGPAVGKTMGDFLGLGHAMQAAQDAANPGVYELLGSAINDAKTHFSDFAQTGLDVVHMLDEFSARITVDLKGTAGTQLHNFLADMTKDLQGIGQVLGNFGHALLNVFAAMPGLVHVLLAMVDGLSRFALVLSEMPAGLITFAMAMEETFRWGGLLLGLFARLAGARSMFLAFADGGGFVTRFGAAVKALVAQGGIAIMWLGQMVGKLAGVVPAAEEAGAAIEAFGADVAIAGATVSTGMVAGITLGVAAFAALIIATSRVKDATQQWVAASDQAVAKASDLNKLNTIYSQLGQTTTRLAVSQGTYQEMMTRTINAGGAAASGYRQQSADSVALANHLLTLVHTADITRANINFLASSFHVSAAGALALANAAGVNLTGGLLKGTMAGKIALQMIDNLRTGLGAMQAPAREVGADMEALGVQSQLAGTKVGQVNQAFDQFVGGTTGAITGLAQFEGQLHQMGHDSLSSSVGITGAINSIARSASSMGFTLQGMGVKAQQSWQQFSSAVQQGNSILDTMRTALAEGAITQGQYDQAIKATAGSLLPFAAHSATARAMVSQLAQEAGFPATTSLKTLAAQLGVTGNKAKGELTKGIEQAIIKMSNLNQVARNLSAVVAGQLDGAMAGAIVKASGLDQAYTKWANDVKSNAGPKTLAQDLASINQKQALATTLQQKGTGILNKYGDAAGKAASGLSKVGDATGKDASATNQAASSVGKHVDAVTKQVSALGRASGALAQQVGKVDQNSSAFGKNTSAVGRASSALAQQTGAVDRNAGAANTGTSAQSRHATAIEKVGSQARTSASALNSLHTATGGASSAAAGATGRMAQLSVSEGRVGSSAFNAAAAVRQLASAIDSLHSKTISVTTVTSTVKGHAAGTMSAEPGLALVGERGPELMVMGGGERIYPAGQTASMLAAMAGAGSAGSGGHMGEIHVHSHAYLDGKEVFNSVRTESYKFQTRNAGARTGLMIPGNKVGSA